MSEINEPQDKIFELEKENEYLKSLLEHAGIPYNRNVSEQKVMPANTFDANQGNRIIPVQITPNHARIFFSYFWGRMDVFSRRYQSKTTGKAGYFPQCDNFWKTGVCPKASGIKIKCKDCSNRSWTKLEPFHIENHLIGKREDAGDVIGIYPLFPDGT